jgi:Tol biopolymer transport system component
LSVLAGSCSPGREIPDESGPSWSPDGGRIAFVYDNDIYVKAADGGGRTNLTNSPDNDDGPTWSPSGDVIAFVSWTDAGSDIHVIHPNGTGKTNLTNLPAVYADLAWSPDGTKIAFASDRGLLLVPGLGQGPGTQSPDRGPLPPLGPRPELHVMNADGTALTRLTFDEAFDGRPTWSPDGTRLAFQSDRDGDHEIYVINVDGTGLTQLTENDRVDALPAWSPDGMQLAFSSNRADAEFAPFLDLDYDIYIMNTDGAEQTNLSNIPVINFTRPSWSPDGRYLAFDGRDTIAPANLAGGRLGNNTIYLMDLEGQDFLLIPVTTNRTFDPVRFLGPVVWSHSGERIAFTSRVSGTRRVVLFKVRDPNVATNLSGR